MDKFILAIIALFCLAFQIGRLAIFATGLDESGSPAYVIEAQLGTANGQRDH